LNVEGTRPDVTAASVSLFSPTAANIDLSSDHTIDGYTAFGGSFRLSWPGASEAGSKTVPLVYDVTPEVLAEAIENVFAGAQGIVVTSVSDSAYNQSWELTFPDTIGEPPVFVVDSTDLEGSGVDPDVAIMESGTPLLNGVYTLTVDGTDIVLGIDDSIAEMESALNTALSAQFSGHLVIVTQTRNELLSKVWQIHYPIVAMDVPELTLDVSVVDATDVSTSIQTPVEGTFNIMGGAFELLIEGSRSVSFDVSTTDGPTMKAQLESLPTVPQVGVTYTSGVVEYEAMTFFGYMWNISFLQVVKDNYQGVISVELDSAGVTCGSNCILKVAELQTGHGPFVTVGLTFDGQHITSDRTLFELLDPISMIRLYPTHGPFYGGTRVSIIIAPMHRMLSALYNYDVKCIFSGVEVAARFIATSSGNTTVECFSPPFVNMNGGKAHVYLTMNNQQITRSSLVYYYESAVGQYSMYPTFGVIQGNTVVNITGDAIKSSVDAYCAFDDQIVVADVCVDGLIACRTPSVATPRSVVVTYSLNGDDYVNGTQLEYIYQERPIITRIDPVRGPVTGNTHVRVLGHHFVGDDVDDVKCRFGDVVVSSVLNTDTSLSCVAPEIPLEYETQVLDVSLVDHSPVVHSIRVNTSELQGDSVVIQASGSTHVPQIQIVQVDVTDVDEIQRVSIAANPTPPFVARISVQDRGQTRDVQVVETSVQPFPEIQAVVVRAPYGVFDAQHPEVQVITTDSPTANVTLEMDGFAHWFLASDSATNVQAHLRSMFPTAVSCTVSKGTDNSGTDTLFSITFTAAQGNVAPIVAYSGDNSASISARTTDAGGFAAIQEITYDANAVSGSFKLSIDSALTNSITFDASRDDFKASLEAISAIGKVNVVRSEAANIPTWTVTFLQRLGNPAALGSVSSLEDASGTKVNVLSSITDVGTTEQIAGTFALSYDGVLFTSTLTTAATAAEVASALDDIATITGVTATRLGIVNNGVMFVITFPPTAGNLPSLIVDGDELTGTAVNYDVITQQDGKVIGGAFRVTNQGDDGFVVRTNSIPHDAEPELLAAELLAMQPFWVKDNDPLIVTRDPGLLPGGWIWTVSFPLTVGYVNLLQSNAAGLSGHKVESQTYKLFDGLVPTLTKVSTHSASTLSGHFYLKLDDVTTAPIPADASAAMMKEILELMPNVGVVNVTRVSTGASDISSWDPTLLSGHPRIGVSTTNDDTDTDVVVDEGLQYDTDYIENIHPFFTEELNTYEWYVNFTTRSGDVPLFQSCCDEIAMEEYSDVTLFSAWSRDSSIQVKKVTSGRTIPLVGNASISYDGVTSFFSVNASETVVERAFNDVGFSDVSVVRSEEDENGICSWEVSINPDVGPSFLDYSLAPAVSVDPAQIIPVYARGYLSIEWVVAPPKHHIQRVVVEAGSGDTVTCTGTFDSTGFTVIFTGADDAAGIETAFNVHEASFGHVSVVFENETSSVESIFTIYPSYLVIFDTLPAINDMDALSCGTEATAVVIQSSNLVDLSGDFTIGIADSDGVVAMNGTPMDKDVSESVLTDSINEAIGLGLEVEVNIETDTAFEKSWLVTFSGAGVGGDVPDLIIDSSNLNGTHLTAGSAEVTKGNQPTGLVRISHNRDVPASDVYIPVLSDSDTITARLADIPSIHGVEVSASGVVTGTGSVVWTLQYDLSATADPSILQFDATDLSATGGGLVMDVTYSQNGTTPPSGGFELIVDSVTSIILLDIDVPTLYDVLLATKYQLFTGCTITIDADFSGSTGYSITLAPGISTAGSTLSVSGGSILLGSGVAVSVVTTASSSLVYDGTFELQFNGGTASSSIDVTASAAEMSAAISSMDGVFGGDGIGGVTVSKIDLNAASVEWRVSFASLKHLVGANALTMTNTAITGTDVKFGVELVRNAGSLPALHIATVPIDAVDMVVTGQFLLQWNGKDIQNIDYYETAAILKGILESIDDVAHAVVEAYDLTPGGYEYIILLSPAASSLMDFSDAEAMTEFNSRLTVTYTGLTNGVMTVSEFAAYSLDVSSSSTESMVSLSLGDIGCDERISGLYCGSQNEPETSDYFSALRPSVADVKSALESLRTLQEVSVSTSNISTTTIDGSYVLEGTRYTVQFLLASLNATGSAVLDLNPGTWTHQAEQLKYASAVAARDYDLPQLIPVDSRLHGGWVTSAATVRDGAFARTASVVSVSVAINGQDWSQDTVAYSYVDKASVTKILPTHGPARGNTEVVVYGSNFIQSSSLSCQFGNSDIGIVKAAYFFNSSAILCIVPASTFDRQVYVKVSNNGEFTAADLSMTVAVFVYEPPIMIKSVFPPSGPNTGNFSVRVSGGPFNNTDELRCKFGHMQIQAFFVDSGSIICWAPAYPPGIYPLEITNNDQDYSQTRFPFFFYATPTLSRISPVSGPAIRAGTEVAVYGKGFINSTSLTCRFGRTVTVGRFVSANYMICPTPQLDVPMSYTALSEQFNRIPDPIYANRNLSTLIARRLFPDAYPVPLYLSRLVTVEISNNMQDFTYSGVNFLYQVDAVIESILPNRGWVGTPAAIAIKGQNFVNSTLLKCRIGEYVSQPTFLAPSLILCFTPRIPLVQPDQGYVREPLTQTVSNPAARAAQTSPIITGPNVVYVEVANNGQDFTNSRFTFSFLQKCLSGHYCPQQTSVTCPPGTFCPGEFNTNYTLCPKGTYNPFAGQVDCKRCPIGFMCPEEGMQVPRICPAGFVCEFTGTVIADNPCPQGHFCLEGTATSATTCGHPDLSPEMFPTLSHAERPSTLRFKRVAQGQELYLGARNSGCWTNETNDFGLQGSSEPAPFWSERHLLPLAVDSPFSPTRGRFCLDDRCMVLEDSVDFIATDYVFDYSGSSFKLRRPVPCPPGMYCHPGTGVDVSNMKNFTTPQPCFESMYCPEGSTDPTGAVDCPPGFYCPFGVKLACPAATYCPRDGHWDPLPCSPGSFNGMLGMPKCTQCPRGYICPGFGRAAPAICPPGFACSREGLASPNQRCPAGYFCPNGTMTVDPFRNDTTLRPYPCDPGTYCLTGVGFSETKVGDYTYAQPCTEGFYCEAASNSPRGSGLCPPGFYCPLATAIPIPSAEGEYAELEGTIAAANCLPGSYAPTIESTLCFPCPPGTSCEAEGMSVADVCPPGTYRSTVAVDGVSCIACPQGTWSKNWGLRESGECVKCPPGSVCPVDGMKNPCGHDDLPMPFEPIVNYQGSPALDYIFPSFAKPPSYTAIQCLQLNPGYSSGTMDSTQQKYFFGELIPPYIDQLGRGPHFRATQDLAAHLKFQTRGQCYISSLPRGTPLYQRLSEFYGPQFDIQFVYNHQGYGLINELGNSIYDGFYGHGSLYIDLPHARHYEPTFNCTKGFRLMNSTRILYNSVGTTTTVYTDPRFDETGLSRGIPRGEDQLYAGTCEADIICYQAVDIDAEAEGIDCPEGYVCDEQTSSDEAFDHVCRAGYVCEFGTTPDWNLLAPMGQFNRLCPQGYICGDGTGLSQALRTLCPSNYYCPTGTGDVDLGIVAGDAANRNLTADQANPFFDVRHVRYMNSDDVRVLSTHDSNCLDAIDSHLNVRYEVQWVPAGKEIYNPYLQYVNKANPGQLPYTQRELQSDGNYSYFRPLTVRSGLAKDLVCARDHKWRLINETLQRSECDCSNFFKVVLSVYRLWQCTFDGEMDTLGIASVTAPLSKATFRDFWFDRPHASISELRCVFPGEGPEHPDNNGTGIYPGRRQGFEGGDINATYGYIPYDPSRPSLGNDTNGVLNLTDGLTMQFTWLEQRHWMTYRDMYNDVEPEFTTEYLELSDPQSDDTARVVMDPFVYDLHYAIRYIEEYGERLPSLVWLNTDWSIENAKNTYTPGRFDMCQCENTNKCPNGTTSLAGSTGVTDCNSLGFEVLRRVSVVPTWYFDNNTQPDNLLGHLFNNTDFWEIGGANAAVEGGERAYPVGTIRVQALDVLVATFDFSKIQANLTYGEHYRIAVYVDCKPCPAQYICDYLQEPPTCSYPALSAQQRRYDECLATNKLPSCIMTEFGHGKSVDCDNDTVPTVEFLEPDLYKCRQIPYFCDDQLYPKLQWKARWDDSESFIITDPILQAQSTHEVDQEWQDSVNIIQDPEPSDLFYEMTPGCCQCEPYHMPYFFIDRRADAGFNDNKHPFVQISILAVEESDLTVVVELLHGQYYNDFDKNIPGSTDIFIHTPGRATYKPDMPNRAAFMAKIESSVFGDGINMPLNLPLNTTRIGGMPFGGSSGTTRKGFATKILMGRISDMVAGDPHYEARYEQHRLDVYIDLQAINRTESSFPDFHNTPDTTVISDALYAVLDPFDEINTQMIWWSVSDPGKTGYLGLPYFPFFSNCKGSDSYLSISKVLETDPGCALVDYQDTVPVLPYPWDGAMIANSDNCATVMTCYYEEQIDIPIANPRWYEVGGSTTLFFMGQEPVKPSSYEPIYSVDKTFSKSYEQYWGRGPQIDEVRGTYSDLPVVVTVSSGALGQPMVIPRVVTLTIEYYQVTKGDKRLVKIAMNFNEQCSTYTTKNKISDALEARGIFQCVKDINNIIESARYELNINFEAMIWFDLMNNFQFTPPIYILFFFVGGMIIIGSGVIVYLINRLFTRLRHPPGLHGLDFLWVVANPAIFGNLLGGFPVFFADVLIYAWLQAGIEGGSFCSIDPENAPSQMCFEDVAASWGNVNDQDLDRAGRKGMAFFGVGLYTLMISAQILAPNWTEQQLKPDHFQEREKDKKITGKQTATALLDDDDEKMPASDMFKPHIWRRANIMWMTFFMCFINLIQLEFSYSPLFGDETYLFIVIYKFVFWALGKAFYEPMVADDLVSKPFATAIGIFIGMATMGAPTFTDFLFSGFVDLYMTHVEKIYAGPFLDDVLDLVPRWKMMLTRTFRGAKRMTREEKAKEELEWREINEEIELNNEGIEPMLSLYADYAADASAIMLTPQCVLLMWMFYYETGFCPSYGILLNQIGYFFGWFVVSIPFTFINDVFMHSANELVHGWRTYDYLAYQKYRFSVREYRWALRNPVVDESINENNHAIDLLCFSSQFYFIVSFFTMAQVNIVFGVTIFMRQQYNPMGDPAGPLILALMFLGGELMSRIFLRLADVKIRRFNWRGLWVTKQIEGTVDDDVAAKLAIGEGRQQDLEQERLELQALNSDRFRHRFLERNRPWILQHLVDLLTPRSLDQPGPDGRPAIEYVRDVYAELMQMGEGLRKAGDKADISDEEGDEMEQMRRNWPRQPLTGASLAIARLWLAKARKRRAFGVLVRGIIDTHKKTSCEICGRNPSDNKVRLVAYLARDGEPDTRELDRLIGLFEENYGFEELDPQLWKAFFRSQAEYCTRCTLCEDAMAQDRMLQAGRMPGAGKVTRPQDISSDEEEDELIFDPIVVTRTSPEGRMMSKWLVAARKKLGGMFPRPDARKQMERYAQKLRQLKLKKAKDAVSKDKDGGQVSELDKKLGFDSDQMVVDNATKALAQRWIRMARDSLQAKFKVRSEALRTELETVLESIHEDDDWYYGAELRLQGHGLMNRGNELEDDRRTLEAEAAVKIHKVEDDLKIYLKERNEEIIRERKSFEAKVAQQRDRIELDIELRKAELLKTKEQRRKEFDTEAKAAAAELGAAPTELIQSHRNMLLEMDAFIAQERVNAENFRDQEEAEARTMFDKAEIIKNAEMERRQAMASENTARIREEVAGRVRMAEAEWQLGASKWLTIARKKVQVKKREDNDARTSKARKKGKG